MDIQGLIGQMNLALIIANGMDEDLVHIPVEDAKEMLLCLESLKALMDSVGGREK